MRGARLGARAADLGCTPCHDDVGRHAPSVTPARKPCPAMCRLLAFAATSPSTFSDVLGTDEAAAFQHLARVHDDGWGAMWTTRDGGLERRRRTGGGMRDAALTNTLNGVRSRAAVAHLRLATGGLPVRSVNTHPFRAVTPIGPVGMAHNGSIMPVADLRALVSPAFLRDCAGTTDSEVYFALVRERLAAGADLPEAVADTITTIRAHFPVAGLNAMVLGTEELVVVRASTHAPVPTAHFAERGLDDASLPPAHDEAYYDLRVRRTPDGSLAFASSGLDTTGWEELPLDSLTVVDLATTRMETHSLATAEVTTGA